MVGGDFGDFRVDGYDIEGLLGAGPTGELWLARHQSSGRYVGLKRLRPKDVDAHDEARRIHAILGMLEHPSLLRVRELLPYGNDELVLVQDHAEGGSLEQLLFARTTLDPGEVVTIAATMAHALAAAHEHGVIHGDVTPESIVFTADGRPLLTDIGLSQLVERWDVLGTHGYADPAAPEQPTPASDVYGLAAVCYTALAGSPLDPGQPHRPLHQVNPGVPPGLAHAIEAGLQESGSARPDAAAFGGQLDAACRRSAVRFPDAPEANPFVLGDPPTSSLPSQTPGQTSRPPTGDPSAASSGASVPDTPSVEGTTAPQGGGTDGAAASSAGPGPFAEGGLFTPGPPHGAATAQADLPDEDEDDERPRREIKVPWKAVAVGVPVVLLLVVGTLVGITLFSGQEKPTPEPTQSVASPSVTAARTYPPPKLAGENAQKWAEVFDELDRHRAEAFAQLDPKLLDRVYRPGSAPRRADEQLMTAIRSKGFAGVSGLRTPLRSLRTVSQSSDKVVLDVVTVLDEKYELVLPDGDSVLNQDRNAGVPRRATVTLVPAGGDGDDAWVILSDVPSGNGSS